MQKRITFDFKKNMRIVFLIILGLFLIITLIITSIFLNDKKTNLNPDSNASTQSEITLSFDKTDIQPAVGEDFSVLLNLNSTNTIFIQGYKVVINFDKNRLQLTNIDYSIGEPSIELSTDLTTLDKANSSGNIALFSEIESSDGYKLIGNELTNLAALQFKYKGNDKAQVSIDENESMFTQIEDTGILLPVTPSLYKPLLIGQSFTTTPNKYYPQETPNFGATGILVSPPPTVIIKTNTPIPTKKTTVKVSPTITPTFTIAPTNTDIPFTTVLPTFTTSPVSSNNTDDKNQSTTISPLEIIIWSFGGISLIGILTILIYQKRKG